MFNFSDVCPNGTFQIINQYTETLGDCFVNACILIPSSLIFSLINIYLIATSADISRKLKNCTLTLMRFIVFLLVAISSVQICLKYLKPSAQITISDSTSLIADSYQFISLVLHFYVVMNKNLFVNLFPIKLLCSLFHFTIAKSISSFNQFYFESNYKSVDSILMLNFFVLQGVYLILILTTYFPSFKLEKKLITQVNIQDTDTEHFIADSNGHVDTETEVKSEEDLANYISYITFKWLKPVMEK